MEKDKKEEKTEEQPVEQPQSILHNKTYKFIIGFVIAIALLIFVISAILLAVRIIPDTFALIASTFQSITSKDATNSTPADHSFSVSNSFVDSGDSTTFSWKEVNTNGKYSINLLCSNKDGVSIEYQDNFLACGEPIIFNQGETSAEITLVSAEKRYLDIPVVLEFESPTGKIETVDEIRVTISNSNPEGGSILGTELISEETTTTPTTINPAPAPFKDLSVRVIQAGEVVNGSIYNSSSFRADSVIGIQFEVRNNGNTATGVWSFQAILPVSDVGQRVFNSGLQNSIYPSSSVIYTLTFAGIRGGNNIALISIDPQNLVRESSESNNQAQAVFSVSGGSSNYNSGDKADFDIDLIGYGRMSGSNFIETRNLDVNDELAIRFKITNVGGKTTERWKFEVNVDEPSGSDDLDYTSARFAELDPGESREITISFDNLGEDGDYDFDIVVDPDRDTSEESRSNNTIRFDVDIDR